MTAWTIDQMRDAVERRRFIVLDGDRDDAFTYSETDEVLGRPEPEGVLVDIQTANVLVTVHDALNERSREKFTALPIDRAVTIAWQLVTQGSKR